MSVSRIAFGFAVVLWLGLFADVANSAAVSSEEAVAFLNRQRAANGIPGDLVVDPNLGLGCRQHNRYMQAEGFGHGEDPSSPYFTPEGAGEGVYGGFEVLATGDSFEHGRNPWEWAPIHLYLLLHPERTLAGFDANNGFACMRVAGARPVQVPEFFSYPGPGSQGIYPDEYAAELPYTPQQLVDIPEGKATGTNILLFSVGTRGLDPESFSLSGPTGAVPARMVDERTENEVGNGHLFAGGGVIVPEAPLRKHATYTVSVKWRNLAYGNPWLDDPNEPLPRIEFFSQEFSFTTGALSPEGIKRRPRKNPTLLLNPAGKIGKVLKLRLIASTALRGRQAQLIVRRWERGCGRAFATHARQCGWRDLGPASKRMMRLRGAQILTLRAPSRRRKLTVKVRTSSFQVGDIRFTSAQTEFTVRH